ncbi:LOW QUALITY PROTEIN: keratin, type I cytoskeletal 9 [Drosophila gunungcola]|uniref:LOW QUALITY PROTEIN: keratin, type I cytoskeletal 9 n=1 Tax=Drosophila gunungcola TaxID=103775 RepID=UPI0022E116F6|nr:LOW QUALITY PROTEIN: keratin, type I cytoskeletal 9 [Drosophila gunungcola]
MRAIMLLSCLAVIVCVQAAVTGPEARSSVDSKDQQLATASVGILDSVLRGKSRQSRCVRCYEDRDRDRYYGGYASRSGDDMRSSAWYYTGYDDRSSSRDRDYDRYYDRSRYDDRYTPRTYDRYEGRGYDDYRRGSGYSGSYDRERGYGYDNRDRYYGGDRYSADRYSEGSSRDRLYDRSRSSGYDRYDPYDRYYSRYDFRNYRPWDETYRGQSGFDNSGRGYYFATDDDESDRNRGYGYSYSRPTSSSFSSSSMSSPCGRIPGNCPYAGGSKVTSSAIGSDSSRVGGHTNVLGSEGGPGSWTYLGDQEKGSGGSSSSASASSGSSSSSNGSSGSGGSRERERERDRERDAQSSSYGGRPRPLGVSYLLERDADTPSDGAGNTANPAGNGGSGGGGAGGQSMPIPAAQTAAEESSGAAKQ